MDKFLELLTKVIISSTFFAFSISSFAFNEAISDKPLSFADNPSLGEIYTTPSLGSGGVRVPNGQIVINEDFVAVAATPDQADEFTEAGFYFLTYGKTPYGNIPLDMEIIEDSSFFRTTRREIFASIIFRAPTTECSEANDCEVRYTLVWNYEFEGLGDDVILSQFVDVDTRTLEVMTAAPLNSIFTEFSFDDVDYTLQLTLDEDRYTVKLPPEVGQSCCPTGINFSYTTIDTASFLHKSEPLFYFSGSTFVMNIRKAYFLTTSFDGIFTFFPTIPEETDTVYIHYTVNGEEFNAGSAAFNFLMERNPDGSFEHIIPSFVGLEEGDVVEYYATYNIDNLFFDTVTQTRTF